MKGGSEMKCEHKRIKSENCVISCIDCGEILPADFLTAGNRQNSADKPPVEESTGKSTRKTRQAKTGK